MSNIIDYVSYLRKLKCEYKKLTDRYPRYGVHSKSSIPPSAKLKMQKLKKKIDQLEHWTVTDWYYASNYENKK